MSYFRELPDFEYQSPFADRVGSNSYVRAKNLFRRVKIRDDLQKIVTLFNKYQIPEGYRPDNAAEDEYGSAQYDWVVLVSAGIINIRDEWPLSNRDLSAYAEEVYGNELNTIRFFETREVKDSRGRLILPAGKVVDSTFTITNPNDPTATLNPVVGITNYEYETRRNEQKRSIYILKSSYLKQFVVDIRRELTYDESSEFIDTTLLRTENTRVTNPQ
jgi:hypothetical protein